jgi:hypothetical protein
MSKLSSGASYLNRDSVSTKRLAAQKRSPFAVFVSSLFAILILLLSVQPLAQNVGGNSSSSPHLASADSGGIVCTLGVGYGTNLVADWQSSLKAYPQPAANQRTWTIQEALGKGMTFITYEGVGEGSQPFFVAEQPEPKYKPGNYDKVSGDLKGARSMQNCLVVTPLNVISTAVLGIANVNSIITQNFVVFAFDSNIICSDPANPGPYCLNLVKIIGGSGSSDGGLIGALTSSIYLPLLVLAVAVAGIWVGYKGIVQRKLREAMFGAIWVCLSAILGLALLLNPMLLAKAPMAVSNVIGTCVIGAFNGDNCLTGGSSGSSALDLNDGTTTSNDVCVSHANVSLDEQMSMTVNSLSCAIWKAFVLEPYAQGSFGTNFASLDTKGNTPTRALIDKAGIDRNNYCVPLRSSGSVNSYSNKTLQLSGGNTVCNLLAYQMYLQVDAKKDGEPTNISKSDRWYNVIVPAANDKGMWSAWAPSPGGFMHKLGISMLALMTSGIAGFVLIVVSLYALVYYISSVILMAFAPLFLLLGVHPGRGKKILLGWLEKVISNVFKYLASATFLIVAIAIYGAVLGNATSPGMTLLFVLILSGALLMFRKEIMDLVGRVSMGGEQMSSAFTEKLAERAKGVGNMALAGAASGVGAKMAGGSITSGAKDGVRRELQRGGATKILGNTAGSIVQNASRQYTRSTVDNIQDNKKEVNEVAAELQSENTAFKNNEVEYAATVSDLTDFDTRLDGETVEHERLLEVRHRMEDFKFEAAREIQEENPFFGQAQLLANQIDNLKFERVQAQLENDPENVSRLDNEISALSNQRETLLEGVSREDLDRYTAEFNAIVQDKMGRATLEFTDQDREELLGLIERKVNAQSNRDEIVNKANELAKANIDLAGSINAKTVKHKILNDFDTNRQPGDAVTIKTIKDLHKEIDETQKKLTLEDSAIKNKGDFIFRENLSIAEVKLDRHPDTPESGEPADRTGGGNSEEYNKSQSSNGPTPDPQPTPNVESELDPRRDNTEPIDVPKPPEHSETRNSQTIPPEPQPARERANNQSQSDTSTDRLPEIPPMPLTPPVVPQQEPFNRRNNSDNSNTSETFNPADHPPKPSVPPMPSTLPTIPNQEPMIERPNSNNSSGTSKVTPLSPADNSPMPNIPPMPTTPPRPATPPVVKDRNPDIEGDEKEGPSGGIPITPRGPAPIQPTGGKTTEPEITRRSNKIPTAPIHAPKVNESSSSRVDDSSVRDSQMNSHFQAQKDRVPEKPQSPPSDTRSSIPPMPINPPRVETPPETSRPSSIPQQPVAPPTPTTAPKVDSAPTSRREERENRERLTNQTNQSSARPVNQSSIPSKPIHPPRPSEAPKSQPEQRIVNEKAQTPSSPVTTNVRSEPQKPNYPPRPFEAPKQKESKLVNQESKPASVSETRSPSVSPVKQRSAETPHSTPQRSAIPTERPVPTQASSIRREESKLNIVENSPLPEVPKKYETPKVEKEKKNIFKATESKIKKEQSQQNRLPKEPIKFPKDSKIGRISNDSIDSIPKLRPEVNKDEAPERSGGISNAHDLKRKTTQNDN